MKYYKYFNYFFLFLLIGIFSSEVLAAGVFDVAPTDRSKQYLGTIFGGNVGAVSLGGGANPIFQKMFERFNFIIVTAGVIVLSYIGIVSAINTAREGEAMGKKFSLWVPLRGLFGMLMMVPTPGTGYSIIQMTVIWIVLNGIGAANAIWGIVLDQLALGIPSVGKIRIDISNSQLQSLARDVLMAQTCMNKINGMTPLDLTKTHGPVKLIITPSAVQGSPATNPTTLTQEATISVGVQDPQNPGMPDPVLGALCGRFKLSTSICKPSGVFSSNVCLDSFNQASITQRLNIKTTALLAMFDAMSVASSTLATSGTNLSSPAPGFFQAAFDAYRSGIAGLAGGVNMPIAQPGRATSSISAPRISGSDIRGGIGSATRPITTGIGTAIGATGRTAAEAAGLVAPGAGYAAGFLQQGGVNGADYAAQGIDIAAEAGAEGANALTGGYAGQAANIATDRLAQGANVVTSTGTDVANWAVASWEQEPQTVPVTQQQVNDIRLEGWIHAGSFYPSLSKSSAQSPLGNELQNIPSSSGVPNATAETNLTNPQIRPQASDWSPQLYDQLVTPVNRIGFNNALLAANQYYTRDGFYVPPQSLGSLGSGQASTGNEFMDKVVNAISSGFRDPILNFFQNELMGAGTVTKGSEDPLVTIGRFGWTLMAAGEIAVFAMIAICFTLLLALAVGSCMSPMAWAANALFMQVFSLLFGILVLLWSGGAMLGVYVPLVPYLIFTTSAIGWFLAVTEALVGGPIIALALTHPSGEELGKVAPALGILVNIFLRPTLMIFGFVLAGGVMRASLVMVNYGFMKAVNDSILPTVFNIIPTLGIYIFLVVAVVNNSFSLIYVLPNKVLRFMGVPGEDVSPEKMMGETKEGFGAGAKIGSDVTRGMFEKGKAQYANQMNRAEDKASHSIGGASRAVFGREGFFRGGGGEGGG